MIEYDMYSRTYAEFAEQRVAKIENSQKGEQRTKGNVTLGDFFSEMFTTIFPVA